MAFRACVLTVSTKGARGERADESGEKVSEELARVPCEIVGRAVVSDEVADIQRQVREWRQAADPDLIVFGGGVIRAAERILPFLQTYVDESTWSPWGKARIVRAQLDDDAAALGVAALFAEGAR